jgi:transposase
VALKDVFDHEEKTQKNQMSVQERLAYHQAYSAPIMATLKSSMETQMTQREVEPNSSLARIIHKKAVSSCNALF